MKKILFISLILVPLFGCSKLQTDSPKLENKPTITTPKEIKRCVCVQMWMPVCGKDKKTYSNACFADCAGVDYSMGSCEEKE